MTDWDQQWQERITKVVRRVAQDLIANDESEISDVVRRATVQGPRPRAYPQTDRQNLRGLVLRAHRPPAETNGWQWTRQGPRPEPGSSCEGRFEACYPFHPATLSVFQRKWASPWPSSSRPEGRWPCWRSGFPGPPAEQFDKARTRAAHQPSDRRRSTCRNSAPSCSASSAKHGSTWPSKPTSLGPCHMPMHSIPAPVAPCETFTAAWARPSCSRSSGGQVDKVAHLPELRFALGEPEVDTTTNRQRRRRPWKPAASSSARSERTAIASITRPTLRKVVSDRQASLDEETEIRASHSLVLVEGTFRQGASLPVTCFPEDSTAVSDSPRLALVVLDPEAEWNSGSEGDGTHWALDQGTGANPLDSTRAHWRGCIKKPGRELRGKRWPCGSLGSASAHEVSAGVLGRRARPLPTVPKCGPGSRMQRRLPGTKCGPVTALWALSDTQEPHGLRIIDLGAGHASASETLCGRIVGALRSEALLNESVGAGYIDRHWPPAFADRGAWPLASLRQSFLNGSLTTAA